MGQLKSKKRYQTPPQILEDEEDCILENVEELDLKFGTSTDEEIIGQFLSLRDKDLDSV